MGNQGRGQAAAADLQVINICREIEGSGGWEAGEDATVTRETGAGKEGRKISLEQKGRARL